MHDEFRDYVETRVLKNRLFRGVLWSKGPKKFPEAKSTSEKIAAIWMHFSSKFK